MAAPLIRFDRFTFTYPGAEGPVLTDVSLEVAEGAFVLVTGPSGAGKSTLLRVLNGLVPHFTGGRAEGRVRVAGHDPLDEGPARLSRVVGFVFQDPEAQFVVDRVEDEVAFALENAGLPRGVMQARVEEALALMGLTPLRHRPLERLSGGEMQRVAVASALALRPRLLVLDEPTSQLDPQSAQELLSALVRLNREMGLTVVLSEHRLERVVAYADQLVYLEGAGCPPLSGPPRQVLAQVPLVPPVVALGRALGWQPLPLTVEEARPFAAHLCSSSSEATTSRPVRKAAGAEAVLRVQDLHVAYGDRPVLQGVDLEVREGEVVALMGRNGAGKTTLLRTVVGLVRPRRGEVKVRGRSVIGRPVAQVCREVGYLPQNPNALLFADTVREELTVTLRNHGLLEQPPIPPDALLARLGLAEMADAYPRDLSVGQRQRVALAAITVTRPPLLLLDEPTRGLDYQAKETLTRLLQGWRAEGVGVLLATHDVELVARLADRVVLLEAGKVRAEGPPARVLDPSSPFAPQIIRLFPGRGWLTPEEVRP